MAERKAEFVVLEEHGARELRVGGDDGAPAKVLVVQFGKMPQKSKEGEPAKPDVGRFEVMGTRVVEGREIATYHYGADAVKVVDKMIDDLYRPFDLNSDDVVAEIDVDGDDFWSLKIEAPKKVTDDVWHMAEYADKLGDFMEVRGELEALLEQTENDEETAEENAMKIGAVVKAVYTAVGGNMKLAESVIRGDKDANDGGNYTRLVRKLGKGSNAIREAMYIADLTDAQNRVRPSTVVSGKAIERHRKVSMEAMVDGFDNKCRDLSIIPNSGMTLDNCAEVLRRCAVHVFGADESADLDAMSAVVDAKASEWAGQMVGMYGKHVNTRDKEEFAVAKQAYGGMLLSSEGEGLFGKAVAKLREIAEIDDAEKASKELLSLCGSRGNYLMATAMKAIGAYNAKVAQEAENRKLIGETEEVDKKVTKSFGQLDAAAAAAHLFKLCASHQDAGDVWAALKSLASQNSDTLKNRVEPKPPVDGADEVDDAA